MPPISARCGVATRIGDDVHLAWTQKAAVHTRVRLRVALADLDARLDEHGLRIEGKLSHTGARAYLVRDDAGPGQEPEESAPNRQDRP